MGFDKEKINEFAEKTGKAITDGVKAGAKYTKEKAPLVGKACLKFGHELKEIFTSKSTANVVDVAEITEPENSEDSTASDNTADKSTNE